MKVRFELKFAIMKVAHVYILIIFRSRYGKLNTLVEVTGRAKMFDGSRMLLPKRLPEDQMTFTVEDTTITLTFRDAKDLSDPQGLRLCNKILNQVKDTCND